METPAWVLLAVAAIPAALTWLYNRHRPRVDAAQVATQGLSDLVDQLQEERETYSRQRQAQDAAITALHSRVAAVEADAREARSAADGAVAENAALVDHHLATVRGVVEGTVPPWLAVPDPLRHRLTDADYPPWPPPGESEE